MTARDAIVIGGGMVGGAIAFGLARAGARVTVFDEGDVVPKDAVSFCIAAALMYHRNKNAARSK